MDKQTNTAEVPTSAFTLGNAPALPLAQSSIADPMATVNR